MDIGSQVLVRSSPSGVWVGRLVAVESGADGLERVTLADARRIWSWSGAGSCSGLAAHGPREGRIAPAVSEAVISSVCERLAVSHAAAARYAEIQPWRP